MAIYHLQMNIIRRRSGYSAVAAASYRASQKLYDQRLGVTHHRKGKQGRAHSEILAPENAPAWATDREQLWNQVESIEKRKDSRVAGEILLSLPTELNLKQQIALTRRFARKNLVEHGLAADINIYSKKGNPHVYIMFTTRTIDQAGFSAKKHRMINFRSTLLEWRKSWAEIANSHLAMAGHNIRIDHRSFAEREIDLQPHVHIGVVFHNPNPWKYDRFVDNQRVIQENADYIIANPGVALDYLFRQQNIFGEEEICKFARRQSIDDSQFENICAAILNSKDLVGLGKDEEGRERYTISKKSNLGQ